jgi:hypothetical protein
MMGIVAPLGIVYLFLAAIGLAPRPGDCLTETLGKISDRSGLDFEISETDCDTLAKDASVSVFASKHGRTREVLLFKYDPGNAEPMPVIASVGQYTIEISVPNISSVFFRRNHWDGLSVHYNIGSIDFPSADDEGKD